MNGMAGRRFRIQSARMYQPSLSIYKTLVQYYRLDTYLSLEEQLIYDNRQIHIIASFFPPPISLRRLPPHTRPSCMDAVANQSINHEPTEFSSERAIPNPESL